MLRNGLDGDDPFCTQQERALDRELADGTAPPDRDGFAALQIAEVRRHKARGKDVRQEEDLFVAEPLRHLDRTDVGLGHAQVLRLAAGVAAQHVRIAEEARRGMAPKLLGHRVIGV